ncbi:MAG: two-component system CheB/CheR fusion protein [Paraglaciecola sp.]|jgi:two-component system CheB/CheR fusion protein
MGAKKSAQPKAVKKIKSVTASVSTVPQNVDFPIVGVGASAGGLAAFEAFFSGLKAGKETGMAFVLVQHLAPDHKSILRDLLQRFTHMKVFEVQDGVVVQPNCVYIIPPNRDMAFFGGTLQLLERLVPRGQRFPIDFLFRSLAHDQQERGICVILSGTGSDGTLGMREIKGEGGLVMVQDPESSEFDGMPKSAIATGLVDYVLLAEDMLEHLIAYAEHAFRKKKIGGSHSETETDALFKKIFVILRDRSGHDFSEYKSSTIKRRIERRMAVHHIKGLDDYVRYIQKTPEETEALFRDFLIGVTNFFRDPEVFTELEQKVIPRLFKDKVDNSDVRVWVCGCSTGEEAYSIAILLHEHMEHLANQYKVQIFASDIDKVAIEQARQGYFPASIVNDVSSERINRYFSPSAEGKSYRIQRRIRDMMIFSVQDVNKDPPFSKMDLVSCRNLLIYLGPVLQKRIISLFHYALNPKGTLLLGNSETIGEFGLLFSTIHRKHKMYQRKESETNKRPMDLQPHFQFPFSTNVMRQHSQVIQSSTDSLSLQKVAEEALLKEVFDAGVLVNLKGDILYLHGRTGVYLEATTGGIESYNILKMARKGLHSDLSIALNKAASTNKRVHRDRVQVKTNGSFSNINLSVSPVITSLSERFDVRLFMVVFEIDKSNSIKPAIIPAINLSAAPLR